MDNNLKDKSYNIATGKAKVIRQRHCHRPQSDKQLIMLFQIWLFRVNQMDGSNSNATELVEQLIDPSEKLLGYKGTKEQSNELE